MNAHLDTIKFVNKTTGKEDTSYAQAFKDPYTTKNGVEQWIKWAQFFCQPVCHRDSRNVYVTVRLSDIDGNAEFAYLSPYLN